MLSLTSVLGVNSGTLAKPVHSRTHMQLKGGLQPRESRRRRKELEPQRRQWGRRAILRRPTEIVPRECYGLLSLSHASMFKERPDVGAAVTACPTGELGLEIRKPNVFTAAAGANRY